MPSIESNSAGTTREIHGSFGTREVEWFSPSHIGSAAFWVDQAARSTLSDSPRIGSTLAEETTACLLGGYGITGPMTVAAFHAVKSAGLIRPDVTASEILAVLSEPLPQGDGTVRRYRFARQRSDRLAQSLQVLFTQSPPSSAVGRELRTWLLRLPGVGMKTASWIARNEDPTQNIAVIDIHILRAGRVAGIFDPIWTVEKDYRYLEDAFCAWANTGSVTVADLDVCIWSQLANAARIGVRLDESRTPIYSSPEMSASI